MKLYLSHELENPPEKKKKEKKYGPALSKVKPTLKVKTQSGQSESTKTYGPALPTATPTLHVQMKGSSQTLPLTKGGKLDLYTSDDSTLTLEQGIKKYTYVANDPYLDYDTRKKMIQQGQKSLGKKLRKMENPTMEDWQKVQKLQVDLQSELKSSAVAAGLLDSLGGGIKDTVINKIGNDTLQKRNQLFESQVADTKEKNPGFFQAGSMAGELAKQTASYMTLGKAAETGLAKLGSSQLPVVGKAAGFFGKNQGTKFVGNVLAQQAADTAAMQPLIYLQGKAAGKSDAQIQKDMGAQALSDLAFNTGLGALGMVGSALGKKVFQFGDTAKDTKKKISHAMQEAKEIPKQEMPKKTAEVTPKATEEAGSGFFTTETKKRLAEEFNALNDTSSTGWLYKEWMRIKDTEGAEAAKIWGEAQAKRREELSELLDVPMKKDADMEKRLQNSLRKELSQLLSFSGKENQESAKKMITQAMQEIKSHGKISEQGKKKLFDALFSIGETTNESAINKEIRDRLRNTKVSISAMDAANIADFQNFRNAHFGKIGGISIDGKNMPVDSVYQELSQLYPAYFPEDIVHPAEQMQQIAKVADDMTLQRYKLQDVTSAEEKAAMEAAYYDTIGRAEENMTKLQQVKQERTQRRINRILESEIEVDADQISTKEVKALYDQRYQLQKNVERVKRNKLLTEGDQVLLEKLLHGEITEETIRNTLGKDAENLLEIYHAEKPYRKVQKILGDYKNRQNEKRQELAEQTLGDVRIGKDGWSEPSLAFSLMRLSPERMFEKVAPKEQAKKLIETYITPIHTNERKKQLLIRDIANKVKPLKLDAKKKYTIPVDSGTAKISESGMVQYLGEKRFRLKQLEEQTKKKTSTTRVKQMDQLRAEITAAEGQLNQITLQKVNRGIDMIQGIYQKLHPKINEVLLRNGYDPVGYIEGYFPHMFFDDASDPIGKALEKIGIQLGYTELPADLAGRTETFRPGKKWSGNLLHREGTKTDYDALRGLENYLYSVGDVIYHTDDIKNLRALEDQLRYEVSPDSIKTEIDAIRKNKELSIEQRQEAIDQLYEKNANILEQPHQKTLQNTVTYLRRYTDLLAGKKHTLDRGVETDIIGRKAYSRMDTFNQRIAANMVGGNIGSALTNTIPFTQGLPLLSTKNSIKGMQEGLVAALQKDMDDLTKKSDFLATRVNPERLYQTKLDKVSDFAGGLMDLMDKFTTQSIWRGRYYDNLKKGMEEATAIREADDFSRRLFGGRSKGAVPPLLQAKNPIAKTLTMFQLEVNNQIDFLTKDVPKEARGNVAKGLWQYAKILAFSYVFNDIYEKMTGRRSALDPVGIAAQAYGDATGEYIRNSFDIAADLMQGEGLQLTEHDKEKSPDQVISNLIGNIGGNVPFVGGLLFDGGRVPQSSAIPNLLNIGTAAAKEFGGKADEGYAMSVAKEELEKPLWYILPPVGGGQLRKTWHGLNTVKNKGRFKKGSQGEQLQFAIDGTPKEAIQAGIFGQWALPEGQAYLDGESGLSVKATEQYRQMQEKYGTETKPYFDTYKAVAKAEGKTDKWTALQKSGLSSAEKEEMYLNNIFTGKKQQEDFQYMKNAGLQYPEASKLQVNLARIEKKYEDMKDDWLLVDKNTKMANEIYDYIQNMNVTDSAKKILQERFAVSQRFIPQEVAATQMTDKWQAANGKMSVEQYEMMRQALKNVTYEKGVSGAKSIAIRDMIDLYTPNLTRAERRGLYEEFGVGKSYW